jgi:hypothetical protein
MLKINGEWVEAINHGNRKIEIIKVDHSTVVINKQGFEKLLVIKPASSLHPAH